MLAGTACGGSTRPLPRTSVGLARGAAGRPASRAHSPRGAIPAGAAVRRCGSRGGAAHSKGGVIRSTGGRRGVPPIPAGVARVGRAGSARRAVADLLRRPLLNLCQRQRSPRGARTRSRQRATHMTARRTSRGTASPARRARQDPSRRLHRPADRLTRPDHGWSTCRAGDAQPEPGRRSAAGGRGTG